VAQPLRAERAAVDEVAGESGVPQGQSRKPLTIGPVPILVGAGLLANAVYQSTFAHLIQRIRQQAGSHKGRMTGEGFQQ